MLILLIIILVLIIINVAMGLLVYFKLRGDEDIK